MTYKNDTNKLSTSVQTQSQESEVMVLGSPGTETPGSTCSKDSKINSSPSKLNMSNSTQISSPTKAELTLFTLLFQHSTIW